MIRRRERTGRGGSRSATIEPDVRRVLVVDGHRDGIELVRRTLVGSGCEVDAAGTIGDGIAAARTQRPDLILCDVAIPGGGSLKLVNRLRSDPNLSRIPVAMMTWGDLTTHWERAARAAGVRLFVPRGDPNALLPLITRAVA